MRADLRALTAIAPRLTPTEIVSVKQQLRGKLSKRWSHDKASIYSQDIYIIQYPLSGVIHNTLHDTIGKDKFDQIRATTFEPEGPSPKRLRTGGN